MNRRIASLAAVLLTGLFTFLTQPTTVAAACQPGQAGFALSDCLTLTDGSRVSDTFKTPASMINLIVANVMILAGIIFFFMIIYSGYLLITGGTKGTDQAKQMLTTAVIGIVLMFSAYWIVQIVQYVTGVSFAL
jgi:hypothetical protein